MAKVKWVKIIWDGPKWNTGSNYLGRMEYISKSKIDGGTGPPAPNVASPLYRVMHMGAFDWYESIVYDRVVL